jgi:tRNA A58 N-methylase Trm61
MTIYLARHVGSSGHVFAIDESAEKLNVARQNINKTGLRNVTFIRADVQELEQLPSKEVDIIFFDIY